MWRHACTQYLSNPNLSSGNRGSDSMVCNGRTRVLRLLLKIFCFAHSMFFASISGCMLRPGPGKYFALTDLWQQISNSAWRHILVGDRCNLLLSHCSSGQTCRWQAQPDVHVKADDLPFIVVAITVAYACRVKEIL